MKTLNGHAALFLFRAMNQQGLRCWGLRYPKVLIFIECCLAKTALDDCLRCKMSILEKCV